jgi:hypothetical protein
MNATKTDVIKVVYNEGEDKPWALDYEDVGVLKTARAALNYPAQKFETEDKAIEVAEMLRDIIHANAVEVTPENEILDNVKPAEFFHSVKSEDTGGEEPTERREDVDFYATDELDEDLIRESQEQSELKNLDTDNVSTRPGESQRLVESELGIDKPYTQADKAQDRGVIEPPPRF